MIKCGRIPIERAIQQYLPGGADEQVLPANNLGNLHGRIIDHAGQLVCGHIVAAPDDKIAEVFAGGETLFAKISVHEGDGFAVRHAKTPAE